MATQRGGYTLVTYIVDVSPSMGKMRWVDVELPNGELKSIEMSNLQWGLQYVKLKIQEMIYNGRKTDQCSVILFGTEETNNILAPGSDGYYGHITEFIPIAQPNSGTIAKLSALEASSDYHKSDAIDAVVIATEMQSRYLGKKKWSRKIVIVTDGENPISDEDWEPIVSKLDEFNVQLTVIGIDFDDEEIDFAEVDKSDTKRQTEEFYHQFTEAMNQGIVGTCSFALEETARPEMKTVTSALTQTVLRIGDIDARQDEALELPIQLSKYTAVARPKGWKKFALRVPDENAMEVERADIGKDLFAQLHQQSEYYIDPKNGEEPDGDVKMEPEDDGRLLLDGDDENAPQEINYGRLQQVEREELIRGYKYGTTFVPCPDDYPRLPTRKGMDLCGFFKADNLRREYVMGEVSYVWGGKETKSKKLLSSMVRAMTQKNLVAIVRSVSRDGMDPKMGILVPQSETDADYFTWVHMPFADDVRKYNFPSLFNLKNKSGKEVTEHAFLPTEKQMDAMENFVDAMDLMDCGPKDEETGIRGQWYDPTQAYNPALHRIKQTMFHAAVTDDVSVQPPPRPHPETLTFFEPPKRALKRAQEAIEECKEVFNVKQVPKRVAKSRKDGHVHATDEGDDEDLLLNSKGPALERSSTSRMSIYEEQSASKSKAAVKTEDDDDLTEDDSEEELLLEKGKKPATPPRGPGGPARGVPLPTPARSTSPDDVETDKAPGRIIGSTLPLKDFRKNIAQGDIVSKAVEDLCAVVLEILMRPFASRRKEEMLECLEELRKTCLEEDEIEAWNKFLPELKAKCLSKPGNPDFWKALQMVGRDLSLISKNEAKQQGGESQIGENEATEFLA